MSKTTEQTLLDEAASANDFLDIVDVSDNTDSTEGSSKKITVSNLILSCGLKIVSGYEGYLIIAAQGNTNINIVEENDLLIGKGAYYNGGYVMMRASQDNPTQDSEFALGLNGNEF